MGSGDYEVKSYFSRKRRWTEHEKKSLLVALRSHGSSDIEKLKEHLPNKTTKSIQQMIKKYKAIADLGKKDIYSPLDVWVRSGIFDAESNMISEALLFIYLFEKHPPPNQTAGFDIKNVYKFMYEAATGEPTTNLSRKTAYMLKDLIYTVDREFDGNLMETTDWLISELACADSERCYKKKKRNTDSDENTNTGQNSN
ncbi:uncharacterized protein LOC106658732 [Trichogramma pretiosum]|uniref:Myb-like domain-containing protein n=1 Tax=Trichogramma kaykai TaxID=54128 RepID=A0ABD2X7T7_9HYME|nr:uncharacterized protein LOC106658732 [Trichogramma pretiosum]